MLGALSLGGAPSPFNVQFGNGGAAKALAFPSSNNRAKLFINSSFTSISLRKAVAAVSPDHLSPVEQIASAWVNNTRRREFGVTNKRFPFKSKRCGTVKCSRRDITDFIGGDLLKFDLGRWLSDVEEHKALAIYTPHEGGYEGRYLNRLRYQGYYFLDLTARGLGDPETTLTKIHPVCPPHVGKQPIARWYFPPEVDYRLQALPPDAKGLVVWVIEAKVLSKSELQFLALLPSLRPKVRVIAECGNWRKVMWKPLKEIAGLTTEDGA